MPTLTTKNVETKSIVVKDALYKTIPVTNPGVTGVNNTTAGLIKAGTCLAFLDQQNKYQVTRWNLSGNQGRIDALVVRDVDVPAGNNQTFYIRALVSGVVREERILQHYTDDRTNYDERAFIKAKESGILILPVNEIDY